MQIMSRPAKLVLEDGSHESIIEESGGPVDDVQRLRLRIVGFYAARRAENCAMGQGRSASLAGLALRPAA